MQNVNASQTSGRPFRVYANEAANVRKRARLSARVLLQKSAGEASRGDCTRHSGTVSVTF